MLSGKLTDKLLFTAIYCALGFLAIWGARSITNYALDVRFYREYLQQWQTSMLALRHQASAWPPRGDMEAVDYMQVLMRHLRVNGVSVPSSNTEYPFVYRLSKFGERSQRILMLYDQNRLILYGLPESTFEHLDHFIDGQSDPGHGDFTGRWSADQISRIAQWKL